MQEITIRPATPDDTEFLVAGNAAMAQETESRTLDPATLSAGVSALFEDPSRGFYLIAELAGRPAGQMMITYEWSDWRNATFWWIQSVYTLPESRRRGVFTALYSHIEAQARHSPRRLRTPPLRRIPQPPRASRLPPLRHARSRLPHVRSRLHPLAACVNISFNARRCTLPVSPFGSTGRK